MYLAIVQKELQIYLRSSNYQNSSFEKITITVTESALIQVSFPNVDSKKKLKMNTRNTKLPSSSIYLQPKKLLPQEKSCLPQSRLQDLYVAQQISNTSYINTIQFFLNHNNFVKAVVFFFNENVSLSAKKVSHILLYFI